MNPTEPPKFNFENRTVIVTGAASGMGRATAMAFARCGAKVLVADVSDALGQQVVSDINREAKVPAVYLHVDVSRERDVQTMIEHGSSPDGRLDYLINAAGIIHPREPLESITEVVLDRTFAVNFKGAFFGMKHAIPALRKNGGGVIVNFASVQGFRVLHKGASFYAASKAALISLTKSGALEYGAENIRVVAVAPGPIDTPMLRSVTGNVWPPRIVSDTPLARLGESDEVAQAVLWLCSGGASYVSGATLPVDGGFLAP